MRRLMYSSGTSVWGSHADELGGARGLAERWTPYLQVGVPCYASCNVGVGAKRFGAMVRDMGELKFTNVNKDRLGVKGGRYFRVLTKFWGHRT